MVSCVFAFFYTYFLIVVVKAQPAGHPINTILLLLSIASIPVWIPSTFLTFRHRPEIDPDLDYKAIYRSYFSIVVYTIIYYIACQIFIFLFIRIHLDIFLFLGVLPLFFYNFD